MPLDGKKELSQPVHRPAITDIPSPTIMGLRIDNISFVYVRRTDAHHWNVYVAIGYHPIEKVIETFTIQDEANSCCDYIIKAMNDWLIFKERSR